MDNNIQELIQTVLDTLHDLMHEDHDCRSGPDDSCGYCDNVKDLILSARILESNVNNWFKINYERR